MSRLPREYKAILFTKEERDIVKLLVMTELQELDHEAEIREEHEEELTLYEKSKYGKLQSVFKKITGKDWS